MDSILKGIVNSAYSSSVKKALVEKVIIPGAQSVTDPEVCNNIFYEALRLSIQSKNEIEQGIGFLIFEEYAKRNPNCLNNFCMNGAVKVLTTNRSCNAFMLLQLMNVIYKYSHANSNFEEIVSVLCQTQIGTDIKKEDLVTYSIYIVNFLKEYPVIVEKSSKKVLINISNLFINCIANCKNPLEKPELVEFVKNVDYITEYVVQDLWKNWDKDAFKCIFEQLYSIMSTSPEESETSVALGSFVRLIPYNIVAELSYEILCNVNIPDLCYEHILSRMINWLHWPFTKNLDLWILGLMKGLAASQKFVVLLNVAESSVEMIFGLLKLPIMRAYAIPVLEHILLSYQHSPALFHKILPLVPDTIHALQEEEHMTCMSVTFHLSDLLYVLMYKHSGFPELYDPVLQALQNIPKPSQEKITAVFKEVIPWKFPDNEGYLSLSLQSKSFTGKVGLNNLGNTCFMNSVLQALFLTDGFRNTVLQTMPTLNHHLLVKLQYVFAFLTRTKRFSYSPTAFLEASKPPWFEQYKQQDCSEFLRHLFDVLHEQEHCNSAIVKSSSENVCQCYIHNTFGGKLVTSFACLNCRSISSRSESYIDIPLAFPDNKDMDNTSSTIELEHLVNHFLAPEILKDENSYHCEQCSSLQSAEKNVNLDILPPYLILNLLRFSYNTTTMMRNKILTHVKYPLQLALPCATSDMVTAAVSNTYYSLYAVVLHSGSSSDSGHYYTYARHSDSETEWHLFNDNNVSFANFDYIQSISERHSRDTPYLLFYKKNNSDCSVAALPDPVLRRDLMEAVEQDNRYFLQEVEAAEARKKRIPVSNGIWKDFDDHPPGCGGDQGGGGSFGSSSLHTARFVY